LAAAPDGAVAVLVGGEIVDDRHHLLAVGIARVGVAEVARATDIELAVRGRAAIEHQAVEVGVRGVGAELAHLGPARRGVLADFGTLVRAHRVLWHGEPPAYIILSSSYLVAADVGRIRRPDGRRGVLRWDMYVYGCLTSRFLVRQNVVRRLAWQVGVA